LKKAKQAKDIAANATTKWYSYAEF